MQFHKQRFRHDPANGVYGDCGRTALACLLDLRPEDVPHFGEGNPTDGEFYRRERDFLRSVGLAKFTTTYEGSDLEAVLRSIASNNPGLYYQVIGKSARDVHHVVVCRDDRIIHDPHPDGGGLTGPCDDGYYWVEVLIPAAMVERA